MPRWRFSIEPARIARFDLFDANRLPTLTAMYQYRIFSEFRLVAQRVMAVIGILIALVLAGQILRLLLILRRVHPLAPYAVAGLLAIVFIYLAVRFIIHNRDHRMLTAAGYNLDSTAGHRDLKEYLQHLIRCIKRMASNRLLTDEQSARIRQQAHDIEESLNHHPLNDDLIRGIAKAREEVIAPTFAALHQISDRITASKARSVTQDLFQPPFPIIAPLVVFYHQFTLVSEIADIYLARPTLREYYLVLRDVWSVMTKGDFLRYGQRLFAGINSNTFRLGRPSDDLGQIFSIIWLTNAFSQAAVLRCCTLHDWNLNDAIGDMQAHIPPCLDRTRQILIDDALPLIKKRIRVYAPVDHDPNVFSEEIAGTFVKSVDSVIVALSAPTAGTAADGTSPGLVVASAITEPQPPGAAPLPLSGHNNPLPGQMIRVRRRRRRRHSNQPQGSLMQRFIYLFAKRRD